MNQGLLFAVVLISFSFIALLCVRRPGRSDLLASAFLASLTVSLVPDLLRDVIDVPFFLRSAASDAVPFLFPPLLYLFLLSRAGVIAVFRKRYLLHFVPFLAALVLFSRTMPDRRSDMPPPPMHGMEQEMPPRPDAFGGPPHSPPADMHHERPEGFGSERMAPDIPPFEPGGKGPNGGERASALLTIVYFAAYSAVILLRLRRAGKTRSSVDTHWMVWLCASFPVVFLVMLVPSAAGFAFGPGRMTLGIGSALYIPIFGSFALIYRGVHPPTTEEEKIKRKYEKSGLKDGDIGGILSRLETWMKDERPFLDPDFSIDQASKKLGVPKHHLTQALNSGLERNFYSYVNEYRVREAASRMKSAEYASHSVIRIAYDCGFNSKSSFNSIFKKSTGSTPSEFRARFGANPGEPEE